MFLPDDWYPLASIMQVVRNALFLAYGSSSFTRAAYLKRAKNFEAEDAAEEEGSGAAAADAAAAAAAAPASRAQVSAPRQDLSGRVCVVTGANQGIGRATATAMAQRGATVHLLCRSESRGASAALEISQQTGNSNVHAHVCDLASMGAIRAVADELKRRDEPVHVLVNNAGVMEHQRSESTDGFELNFAVNVLGTFLLTEALLPLLQRGAPESRVVTVATGGILTQPLSNDLQMDRVKFDGTEAYARNKRVQTALTEKWSSMYGSGPRGVGFYCMHPGWVDTTVLQTSMPAFHANFKSSLRSPSEGADTIVWLARQPRSKLKEGGFYFDRQSVTKHLPLAWTEYTAPAVDEIYDKLKQMAKL